MLSGPPTFPATSEDSVLTVEDEASTVTVVDSPPGWTPTLGA